jgi:heme-degrading monooxygenase HmoA
VIPSRGGCGEPVSSPTCLTNWQEDAMSIVRLIQIKINPLKSETTERILKDEFASLMMSQKGFMSEKLLRVNSGEFISYSEWETKEDMEHFTSSAAHMEFVRRMRDLGAYATVTLCNPVN